MTRSNVEQHLDLLLRIVLHFIGQSYYLCTIMAPLIESLSGAATEVGAQTGASACYQGGVAARVLGVRKPRLGRLHGLPAHSHTSSPHESQAWTQDSVTHSPQHALNTKVTTVQGSAM